MSDFITLREFHDQSSLDEITVLLQGHGIACKTEDTRPRFDVTFAYNDTTRIYRLLVPKEAFDTAKKLLEEQDTKTMEQLPSEYYLFSFTNDELLEILIFEERWNPFDVRLARHLLLERGMSADEAQIKRQREAILHRSTESSSGNGYQLVIAGYVLLVLGLIGGLFIALYLLTARQRNGNAKKRYLFPPSVRMHGKIMLAITLIVLLLLFPWKP